MRQKENENVSGSKEYPATASFTDEKRRMKGEEEEEEVGICFMWFFLFMSSVASIDVSVCFMDEISVLKESKNKKRRMGRKQE